MGVFRDWLLNILNKDTSADNGSSTVAEKLNLAAEVYIRELAMLSAIGMIARCVSKCEFRTYVKGELTRGAEYYLWNVSPNKNQNSSAFIQKWITKLYTENEALIVDINGQLLVADSFSKKKFALLDYVFEGVTVDDYTFSRPFFSRDVLYFELNNLDINKLLKAWYAGYGQLVTYAMRKYKLSRGEKGIMTVDTFAPGSEQAKRFKKMMSEDMRTFTSADNAVLPIFDGHKYDSLTKNQTRENSRDIRAMVDDVYDITARALGIAPVLLKGEIAGQDEAMDRMLTMCVDPLCDMLQEEINRKRYTRDEFLCGSYVQIDTTAIKHIDILNVAGNIDKLISSGVFCVNDIRAICGEPTIDEPWAWKHFLTKNYDDIQKLAKGLEDEDE